MEERRKKADKKVREAAVSALEDWHEYSDLSESEVLGDTIPGWVIAAGVEENGGVLVECFRWSALIRWYKRACKLVAQQLAAGEEANMGEAMNNSSEETIVWKQSEPKTASRNGSDNEQSE